MCRGWTSRRGGQRGGQRGETTDEPGGKRGGTTGGGQQRDTTAADRNAARQQQETAKNLTLKSSTISLKCIIIYVRPKLATLPSLFFLSSKHVKWRPEGDGQMTLKTHPPPTSFFSSTLMLLLALSSSSFRLSSILPAFVHFFLSSSQVFGRRSSGCSPLPTLSRGPEKKAAATHSFHEMRLVEATLLASSSGHQPRRKRDRVHPSLPSLPPRCMVARSPFIIIIPFFFLLVSFFFHLLPFSPLLLPFFSPPPASTHPLVRLIQREWVEKAGRAPSTGLLVADAVDRCVASVHTYSPHQFEWPLQFWPCFQCIFLFLFFLVSSRTFFSWLGVASIFDHHRAPTSSFDCCNEKKNRTSTK